MDCTAPPPPSPPPPLPLSPPPPMPDDGSTPPPPLPPLSRESISMELDSSSETVGPPQQGQILRQEQRQQQQVEAQEGNLQEFGRGQGSESLHQNGVQRAQRSGLGVAPAEARAQAAATQDAGPSSMQQVGTLQHAARAKGHCSCWSRCRPRFIEPPEGREAHMPKERKHVAICYFVLRCATMCA